jgi:hypothetical protein
MVFPNLGCLTCKRRRVKVSREQDRGPSVALVVDCDQSVIRPGLFAADAAQETEVILGYPVEIRAYRSGPRMSLLRASPDVREATQLIASHGTPLLVQEYSFRFHLPCLSP